MATDYDDIIERLTKRREFEINLKDVFNEEDLNKAIKKSFADDDKRNTLERNKDDLFKTKTTQDSVVDNSTELIEGTKSLRDLETTFDNITSSLGDIGRIREIEIETAQAEKTKELAGETPGQLTRVQLLDLGVQGTSFSKSASRLGIEEEDFRTALEREGFSITERNTIKK